MAKPAIALDHAGEYNVEAVIPARLLLPGRYSVTLALHVPKAKMYDLRKQALSFRIVSTIADRFGGFADDELGQIFADVKWRIADPESRASNARIAAAARTN